MIEAKLVRKNIEMKKMISDVELNSHQMYNQTLQIRESMEIEWVHAKRERAENDRLRAHTKEVILDMLKKEKILNGIKPYHREAQS